MLSRGPSKSGVGLVSSMDSGVGLISSTETGVGFVQHHGFMRWIIQQH
ncbi:hypothetical protein RBSH_04281 [Rhodopirellula baltica SH28]|uniref:Uncharacterized protein n=1 Tax=Rhodopirellula baltica SH28 TaxID=993517 RepID=K5CAT1_RHOBT|nr:hypothetical protein RBSH_04281 [Rhodopirellula baltica SH28]